MKSEIFFSTADRVDFSLAFVKIDCIVGEG